MSKLPKRTKGIEISKRRRNENMTTNSRKTQDSVRFRQSLDMPGRAWLFPPKGRCGPDIHRSTTLFRHCFLCSGSCYHEKQSQGRTKKKVKVTKLTKPRKNTRRCIWKLFWQSFDLPARLTFAAQNDAPGARLGQAKLQPLILNYFYIVSWIITKNSFKKGLPCIKRTNVDTTKSTSLNKNRTRIRVVSLWFSATKSPRKEKPTRKGITVWSGVTKKRESGGQNKLR